MRPLPFVLCFAACAPSGGVSVVDVDGWSVWLYVPSDLEDRPVDAIVHLHHSGRGEDHANEERVQRELTESGLIGVFPQGGGLPGDDWVVGRNKDGIERDDRAFLAEVARTVRARDDVNRVFLGGFSKGGAMTYDMACLGEDVFDGFLPMSGAMEDWVFESCPATQRPIRHLQGTEDERWPMNTADDPDSSHQGIIESIAALQDDPGCMAGPGVVEGDCTVWPTCAEDTRICTFVGGHWEPTGYILGHAAWIAGLEAGGR